MRRLRYILAALVAAVTFSVAAAPASADLTVTRAQWTCDEFSHTSFATTMTSVSNASWTWSPEYVVSSPANRVNVASSQRVLLDSIWWSNAHPSAVYGNAGGAVAWGYYNPRYFNRYRCDVRGEGSGAYVYSISASNLGYYPVQGPYNSAGY